MKNKFLVSILIVVVVIGIGFVLFSNRNKNADMTNTANPNEKLNETPQIEIASKDVKTWKYFDKMQPTFLYPPSWTVEEEIYTRTQEEIERDQKNNRLNIPTTLLVGAKIYPTNKIGYGESDYIRVGGRRLCPELLEPYNPKAYWKWEDFGGVEKDIFPPPTKHFCDQGGVSIDTWSNNPEVLEVFNILVNNLSYG